MGLTIAGDHDNDAINPVAVGDAFASLVAEVEWLHRIDAQHRKGRRLRAMSQDAPGMLLHAASELVEVHEADSLEHAEQEMGDALAILVHYCLAHGLSLVAVAERWLAKVATDFPRASRRPSVIEPASARAPKEAQ